jgi:acyl carrier protein
MKTTIDNLTTIFREVFENEQLIITSDTVASDIQEWDSINHIYLIVEIEKAFSIKFTTMQIQSWKCVGDILAELNK